MNQIYIIVAIKASNLLFPQLRTVLFSTRGREIAKPSKIPRKYNTRASLDSSPCKKDVTDTKAVSGYWGVAPLSLINTIGIIWKWNCFHVKPKLKSEMSTAKHSQLYGSILTNRTQFHPKVHVPYISTEIEHLGLALVLCDRKDVLKDIGEL